MRFTPRQIGNLAQPFGSLRHVLERPLTWPMRYTIAHWAALMTAPAAGEYELCCRTIDGNGIAQPLPRPLPKSGRNELQRVPVIVEP